MAGWEIHFSRNAQFFLCSLIGVADGLPKLGVAVNPVLVLLVYCVDDRDNDAGLNTWPGRLGEQELVP